MRSLLSSVQKVQVIEEPFPHVIVRDALEDEVCLQLIREFPPLELVAGKPVADFKNNERFSYHARNVLQDSVCSPLWKAFVQAHVDKPFMEDLVRLFGDSILRMFPDFEQRFGKLESLRPGVRGNQPFSEIDIALDAQICINTPVTEPSTVRGPHVDVSQKLFAALFYMRPPGDDSTGGDLEIYRFKKEPYGFRGQFIDPKYVEVINTVRYERNVLVFLINSVYSLHGVTVRQTTPHPRLFFNLLGEMRQGVFNLRDYQERDEKPREAVAGYGD